MSEKSKKLYIRADELQPLIETIKKAVVTELIADQNIRLDSKQLDALAKSASKHIRADIDYSRIEKGKDGENLVWCEAVKNDTIQGVLSLVPKPKDGENYSLTGEDRADIAGLVKKLIPTPTDGKDGSNGLDAIVSEEQRRDIIDEIINQTNFVSRGVFKQSMENIKKLIDSSKSSRGGAGISGGDMIEEINKILGESWQSGGGGGVAWGDSRADEEAGGIGLAHNIGVNAPAGTVAHKITLNNAQSSALSMFIIELGTSNQVHEGLKIKAPSTTPGLSSFVVEGGEGSAFHYKSVTSGGGVCLFDNVDFLNAGGHQVIFALIRSANFNSSQTKDSIFVHIIRDLFTPSTVTDDFYVQNLIRESNANVSGTNIVINGGVQRLENKSSAVGGATVTDNTVVQELVQGATIAGLVSGVFKRVQDIEGVQIFVSDGTTPQGNLNAAKGATVGSICYNGPSGQPFYFTGTASDWTGM